MRLFQHANYNFMGRRRIAYVVTAAAFLVCLVGALVWQTTRGSWLRYGVDFTGGTLVQVRFNQEVDIGELRSSLSNFPNAEITRFGEENEYLIRLPEHGETTTDAAEAVPQALADAFGDGTFAVARVEAVGAKVGGELQTKAMLAILLSFGATLIYLAFRFEWRFGLAAVIATLHDVTLTLGLISVMQLEVGLPMVAAVLTIVGYSLNDTIVIFDRIRENLHGLGRRANFEELLNRSINETLPRTVLTSMGTLATLVSLVVFGGATLREFAFILIVGIVLGTFSSIFIASPALLEIEKRWPVERKKAGRPAKARATA